LNSLNELKKVIQSINENITDSNINTFQQQILQFGHQYEKTQTVASLLKMMQSLGKYLGVIKNNAHADSIPLLNSIAVQFDKIISNSDLEKDETDQILSTEIQKYKSFKNKLAYKPSIDDNDLNDIKAVILSVDWEISTTTLQNFEQVVASLLSKLKYYKIHYTFLKIIHSIGRYIGIQKANAHTDSISFLHSIFENFEQIVQTPDMAFNDKKKLLETDINRFHEFKHKISLKKKRTHLATDISEDENIQPALSQFKQTSMPTADEVVPLTTLPEQENSITVDKPESATIKPPGPKDVMDDLFSAKESPADELLDAIHMLDVQGTNQDQAMEMLDQTSDQDDEIKNFTPQQRGNAPIPEIGDRLDEFFNLEPSLDDAVTLESSSDQTPEIDSIALDAPADGIVPFQQEDESFEESLEENFIENSDEGTYESNNKNGDNSEILNRLKSTFESSEWLKDGSSMLSINQDIFYLEKHWENDPDKTCLLQIIVLIINLMKNQSEGVHQENVSLTDEGKKDVFDTTPVKTTGILGKIKGLFTS